MLVPLRVSVAGREYTLETADSFVVGSDPGAAIPVEGRGISRRHGRLSWTGDHWQYEDLESTNGSYQSGRRITAAEVHGPIDLHLGHPDDGLPLRLEPQVARTQAVAPGTGPLTVATGASRYTIDPPGPALIGRDPDATVTLDADGVSFRHAELSVRDGTWTITDLDSTYGTFSEGERIDTREITQATTVRLGDPGVGPSLTIEPGARPSAATARPGVAVPVAPARSSLLIGDLGGPSTVHRAGPTVVRIGRAPDNDVVIDDLTVSRYHAELRGDDAGGYELADLGSFNGTFVNGRQSDRARLTEGDIVSIGHRRLRLVAGALEEYVDTGDVRFEVAGLTVAVPNAGVILDGVSFALEERSLMAVVGPSGAGKSTLLNALTGFRPADEGRVLYDGRDLYAAYDDLRRRIGYVPQDDILHTELTVRKGLEYAARLRFPADTDPADRTRRIEEVMEELGLSHRADVPISRLSGGQRKRASVAIELLTKPSLLFLDEPTSGLDPGYERALTELLRDLADGGRTVVVVTHSVQSLDLCDRIIFLAPGGRTAFFGPPSEVMSYFGASGYAEVFVKLEEQSERDWTSEFSQTEAHRAYVAEPLSSRAIDEPVELPARAGTLPRTRQSWFRQFATLTRRYLSVIGSDRKLVWALALQAPILGLLMLAALPPGELAPLAENELARLSQATAVLAVLVIGVTGLGISNSIREIVKEAAVYRRERSVGLSVSAYVASKAVVLSLITGAQAAALVLIAVQRQGSGWGSALFEPAQLELAAGFVMAGLAAMGLGLLVSAISTTPDRAISILPILLILQLVVSGAFKSVLEKPILREASYLASAQWGFSAGAATIDLNELQALNDCLAADLSIGSPEDVRELVGCSVIERAIDAQDDARLEEALIAFGIPPADARLIVEDAEAARDRIPAAATGDAPPLRFWDQEPGDWLANIGILAGFTAIGVFGSWFVLRRRDPQVISGG